MFKYISFVLFIQTIQATYPVHLDLQQVDKVSENGEPYKDLKYANHFVTDKNEEMPAALRRTFLPGQETFVDSNGLKHFWSRFNEGSLDIQRRTNIINNAVNNIQSDTNVENSTNKINASTQDTKVEVLNVENNTNKIEETTQNTTVIAMQQSSTTDHQKTENVVASLPNQKKRRLRRKKKTKESMREGKKDETGKGDGKKTVALTTMYCPFLGIIHMVNELH